MSTRSNASITIDGLRIRVSSGTITPAQGQQLGERVQTLLAERLASWDGQADREIGAITMTLTAGENASVDQLASRIVDAIMRQV